LHNFDDVLSVALRNLQIREQRVQIADVRREGRESQLINISGKLVSEFLRISIPSILVVTLSIDFFIVALFFNISKSVLAVDFPLKEQFVFA